MSLNPSLDGRHFKSIIDQKLAKSGEKQRYFLLFNFFGLKSSSDKNSQTADGEKKLNFTVKVNNFILLDRIYSK